MSVKEFYPYLYGFSFVVFTDHNPLVALKGIKDYGGRISRWLLFLQQFDFEVKYKVGRSNTDADALSRRTPSDSEGVAAILDTGHIENPNMRETLQVAQSPRTACLLRLYLPSMKTAHCL